MTKARETSGTADDERRQMLLPQGLRAWLNAPGEGADQHLDEYFSGVSRARYVIRRIFRIFDEQASGVGLEPLQHQALVQVVGRQAASGVPVSSLAERLDVPPALASRLVRDLVDKGLVERRSSETDKRVTLVVATSEGRDLLARISRDVHKHVAYFQSLLTEQDRTAALAIFAFYVGVPMNDRNVEAVHDLVRSVPDPRAGEAG
jgi:DNA-binding MarR family transcriptional regulator